MSRFIEKRTVQILPCFPYAQRFLVLKCIASPPRFRAPRPNTFGKHYGHIECVMKHPLSFGFCHRLAYRGPVIKRICAW